MNAGMEIWSLRRLIAVLLVSVTQASLFAHDEPISQLQTHNFSSVIHNSKKMWIVDFYASWCGYCQRLAPEFSSMARDIQGWSEVVGVASVACSDTANSALCRNYDIKGYPSIRFFPPNSESSFQGFRYEGDKLKNGLVTAVLDYLKQFVAQRKTDQSWPELDYVRDPRTLRTSGVRDVYIVVENRPMSSASVGLSVILDRLSSRPEIVVGRMNLSDAEVYRASSTGLYQLTPYGDLRQVSRETNQQRLSELISFHVVTSGSTTISTPSIYATTSFIFTPSRGVHMQDLESSLYYSFFVEIPSHNVFDEESLETLKKYVNLLNKYHPGEPHVKLFLSNVNQWLSTQSAPLTAQSWLQRLRSIQSNVAYVRESLHWTGCNGTLPQFRGYPCSLWMTFHAITVSAYVKQIHNASFNPKDILIPIRDYVKTFFSCRPCSANFVRRSKDLDGANLMARDVVLWLWKIHNRANVHLHGDATEDPRHPKIQFPSYEACPACRITSAATARFNLTDDMWIESNVLTYLLRFYGQSSIVDDDIEGFSAATNGGAAVTVASGPDRTTATPCVPVTTDWSPCSHTCDVGTSMRMTMNSGTGCQLQPEVRLCLIRPCVTQFPIWSDSRWRIENCPRHGHTYRLVRDIPMTYGNCSTEAAAFWRVCGKCPPVRNRPVCCNPSRSSTQPRRVTCAARDSNGRQRTVTGTVMVEVIDFCRCDHNCSG